MKRLANFTGKWYGFEMKIYRREAFMRLPSGTIFAKGKPWAFGELCRFDDAIRRDDGRPFDFVYTPLVGIDMGEDSGEWASRMDDMLENGASYPINTMAGRDGCFDDDELFLVYEPADIEQLITLLRMG